jgi:hypothetical protein
VVVGSEARVHESAIVCAHSGRHAAESRWHSWTYTPAGSGYWTVPDGASASADHTPTSADGTSASAHHASMSAADASASAAHTSALRLDRKRGHETPCQDRDQEQSSHT